MRANKGLVQLTAAMAAVALPVVTRGGGATLTSTDWINVAISVVGAGSVYMAANLDGGVWGYTKAIFSAMSGGLVLLVSYLTDGVQAAEWSQIFVAFLATGAVALVSNDEETPSGTGKHRAEAT